MSIIQSDLLLGQEGSSKYQVSRSLRFNSADSAYLSRTPASAPTSTRKFTYSTWVKRSALGSYQGFALAAAGRDGIYFMDTDQIAVFFAEGVQSFTYTQSVFRDVSSWYHILISVDTTQATPANRVVIYVNNAIQPLTGTYVSQNYDFTNFNASGKTQSIGYALAASQYFSGYLAEIYCIDGQALTPSDFAETDSTTGQWIPKAYTGSYGTNGFQLKFADNSNNTATTLGKDTSGNSPANNWTPNNFSVQSIVNYSSNVTYDGSPDTVYTTGLVSAMFDGSTATAFGVNNGATKRYINIDLTGKGVSVSSTFKVYAAFRTGMVWKINGTTVSSSGVTHPNTGWQTLSGWSSGSVTSLYVEVANGNACEIYAVEIDGVVLTNNSGAGNDSLVDTPTSYGTGNSGGDVRGNFCTWNPLASISANNTFTNGNLDVNTTSTGTGSITGTFAVSSGKWYWEVTPTTITTVGSIGINPTGFFGEIGYDAKSYAYDSNANKVNNSTTTSYGASYSANDVIGVALDLDSGTTTLTFYKNGTSQGTAYSGISGTFTPSVGKHDANTHTYVLNAGQRPFAYTAPSGFKALCDTNLTAPVIAKPNTVMDVALYTGTGSSNARTVGFSPDLVWIKPRSNANPHQLFDRVRGDNVRLKSNSTEAEYTYSAGVGLSFDSSGFTVGTDNGLNESGQTFVGWCFDGGTSTVSNTQGSITSSVRANASAGFSIATFTSPSSGNFTVGHGLNVTPTFVIVKTRGATSDWSVYHASATTATDKYLVLNSTAAVGTYSTVWGAALPTSSVVGLTSGGAVATSQTCVMYSWTPIVGYSAMGSYTGNGSSDGPAVWLGFRPRFLMTKRTDSASYWQLYDSARDTYNVADKELAPNASDAETTSGGARYDFLSNGFKLRTTGAALNASGGTYIYFAVAESPFQYARAR